MLIILDIFVAPGAYERYIDIIHADLFWLHRRTLDFSTSNKNNFSPKTLEVEFTKSPHRSILSEFGVVLLR